MEPLFNPPCQKLKKRVSCAVYSRYSRFDKDLELIGINFSFVSKTGTTISVYHQCSNVTCWCRCVDKHDALTLVALLLALSSSIIPQSKNNCVCKIFSPSLKFLWLGLAPTHLQILSNVINILNKKHHLTCTGNVKITNLHTRFRHIGSFELGHALR